MLLNIFCKVIKEAQWLNKNIVDKKKSVYFNAGYSQLIYEGSIHQFLSLCAL